MPRCHHLAGAVDRLDLQTSLAFHDNQASTIIFLAKKDD
jgi:hypothetical protein